MLVFHGSYIHIGAVPLLIRPQIVFYAAPPKRLFKWKLSAFVPNHFTLANTHKHTHWHGPRCEHATLMNMTTFLAFYDTFRWHVVPSFFCCSILFIPLRVGTIFLSQTHNFNTHTQRLIMLLIRWYGERERKRKKKKKNYKWNMVSAIDSASWDDIFLHFLSEAID